ncbi:PepSY-associated TM helix domain-containing protein [Solimonas soli]|uniref:PepSY-associated TM helix domain-containing protein n=1 Tax=Solimonas soli TaxID=413479 RepID=UPI00146FB35C|nr:PepSY-associated TM helix domain-containing protein [Solimonas soli]
MKETHTPQVPAARRQLLPRLRLKRAQKPAAPRPTKNIIAVLREWHSRAGLVGFAFLIWLACTGVLLTRSNELGLDTARVDWPWLMRMYGLHAEPPQAGFRAGEHWVASTNDYTLLDGRPLATQIAAPLGVVAGGTPQMPIVYVAGPASVVLLSPSGERIDELTPPILPIGTVRRIGTLKRDPHVIAVQDLDAYQSADEGNSWTPVAPGDVDWAQSTALSEAEQQQTLPYAKPRIIVEQLLIDLHSGRLFGPVGAWLITIIGFVAVALAISGIWMWWRIRKNRRRLTAR